MNVWGDQHDQSSQNRAPEHIANKENTNLKKKMIQFIMKPRTSNNYL